MGTENFSELEQQILTGDTDAMVNMAILIKSGQTHPFFTVKGLLEKAKEMGNERALHILEGKEDDGCMLNHKNEETLEGSEEDEEEFADSLLAGRYYYRLWNDSDPDERNEQDREKSIALFEIAAQEFEQKKREIDEDLKEAFVILAEYYYDVKKDIEKAHKYNKMGADAGQETLAYTWAMHLRDENNLKGAIVYFEKALYGKLTYLRVHYMLAMIYLETKGMFQPNKDRIIKLINEGIKMLEDYQEKITEEYLVLYLLKGDYYYKLRENKKAIIAYKIALDKLVEHHGMPELASMAAGRLSELYGLSNIVLAKKYSLLAKTFKEKKVL